MFQLFNCLVNHGVVLLLLRLLVVTRHQLHSSLYYHQFTIMGKNVLLRGVLSQTCESALLFLFF
jgi:hypothetical protein